MNAWVAIIAAIGILALTGAIINVASLQAGLQMTTVLVVIASVVLSIAIWLGYAAAKAQRTKVKTGQEALIGSVGVAVTDLNPKGEIRVNGEFWEAIAEDVPINHGKAVEVLSMKGMFLVVKPSEEKA